MVPTSAEGESERPRQSRWLVGGAVTAVVAVGAAGVFAVANLTGSTASGAADPAELGYELLAAIENEDVLGVVDTFLPGEREVLRQPLVDLVAELTRLEVLSPEADLSRILGIDVTFEREDVRARPTNVADIVNLDLRADATITLDGAELPIGALITDNLPDDMLTEMRGTRSTQTDVLDVSLTAVEEDGRWYFSAFHSIAEAARNELAPGSPIPTEGIGADGAASPEAAVDQLLDRIEAIDLAGLIRTLNPGEAAALQRYAPLFLDDAESALAELPLVWRITERSFRVEGDGEARTVFLDALAIEGTLDGEPFTVGFDGDCFRAAAGGDEIEVCGQDAQLSDLDEVFADAPSITGFVETVTDAFADADPTGLELRRRDGMWFVSPTATLTESLLNVFRALDRQELDAIIDTGSDAFDEVLGGGFDVFDDLPVDPAIVDPAIGEGPDTGSDTGSDDGSGEGFDGADWFSCYDVADVAEATACFESFVASGDIDASAIPVELRFPECGYAETSWTGELYQLPDDEFIATAGAARSCFLDLVEQGVVNEWELPSEITHLECFEGRNWYNVFDDPEYDARYYECIDVPIGE
jgi:hypothetical protein